VKSGTRDTISLFAASAIFGLLITACSKQNRGTSDSAEGMRAFLAGMPKAELHLHLECTLSPATIVKIARRNGLDYFTTIGEVEQSLANRPPGLMGFLDHHFKSQNVMQSRQDFYNATYERRNSTVAI